MITAIYSFYAMGGLRGLEVWALFWLLALLLYFGIFLFFKQNRTGGGVKRLCIHLLVCELVFDVLSALVFWVHPFYLEYGAGFSYGLFVWSGLLLVAGILSTIRSHRRIS